MTTSLSATDDTTKTTMTTTPVTVSTTEELLLPLEWTRIQRRPRSSKQQKRKYNKSNSNYDDDETQDENLDACCDDGFCWNRRDANLQYSTKSAVTTTTTTSTTSTATATTKRKHPSGHDGKGMESKNGNALNSILKGKALFCLHSFDCSWFQGQFIINDSNSQLTSTTSDDNDDLLHPRSRHHHRLQDDVVKSLGLLAKRRSDIDECLKCSDGGYSEIDLTVLGRRTHDKDDHVDDIIYPKKVGEHEMMRRSMTIKRLICTGGDMLCIRNSSCVTTTTSSSRSNNTRNSSSSSDSDVIVSFDAEQIITGGEKVDYLTRKYFPNLLSPSIGISNDNGPSALTQYPDCAIVVGNMSLSLPTTFLLGENSD